MEQQERERQMQTIKPRQFALKLSDADAEKLYYMAYSHDTTPEELLESFIMDLVDGTHTHRASARGLVSDYFDHCCMSTVPRRTFLAWALTEQRIDEIIDALETEKLALEDMQYYEDAPDDEGKEMLQTVKETEELAERSMVEIYNDYKADMEQRGEPVQARQDGEDAIHAYMHALELMRGCRSLDGV